VEIGDERSDVADAERPAPAFQTTVAPHQLANPVVPMLLVRVVHREIPAVVGRADVRVREKKLADRRVEGEAVRSLPRRVHEHRARPVEDIAGGNLTAARL
jgi:hypothetical protein